MNNLTSSSSSSSSHPSSITTSSSSSSFEYSDDGFELKKIKKKEKLGRKGTDLDNDEDDELEETQHPGHESRSGCLKMCLYFISLCNTISIVLIIMFGLYLDPEKVSTCETVLQNLTNHCE